MITQINMKNRILFFTSSSSSWLSISNVWKHVSFLISVMNYELKLSLEETRAKQLGCILINDDDDKISIFNSYRFENFFFT